MRHRWLILTIIVITSLILFFLGYLFYNCPLFDYNVIDILTCGFVTYGVLYFTIANENKNNQNIRIEHIIDLINNKLKNVFEPNIDTTRREEYLHTFKYLDNKITVLEKMTKKLGCDNEIKDIKAEKEKLDEYINENLNEGDEYFTDKTRKEKIPNIVENIESRLDTIILKIYGFEKSK